MSKKTLPDELRSVLLDHSLDAPDPDESVRRILADTVAGPASGPADPGPARRWWPPSGQFLAAAAVVAVVVLGAAGINALRNGNSQTSSSTSAGSAKERTSDLAPLNSRGLVPGSGVDQNQPNQRTPGTTPRPPVPADLNCSAILPGSQLVTGAQTHFQVSATGETRYVYEFYCAGSQGQRSGSEIQAFTLANGTLSYLSTLIEAGKGSHLTPMSGVVNGVTLQGTEGPGDPAGSLGGDLLMLTLITGDAGKTWGSGGAQVVAAACTRGDLSAKVTAVAAASAATGRTAIPEHQVLQLTNHSASPCALEGYPKLVAVRDANSAGAGLTPTLRGPAGGVTARVPPIVLLAPGGTAGAIIEFGTVLPSCPPTDQLSVTLPNGALLGVLAARLSPCGVNVHPLVAGSTGQG